MSAGDRERAAEQAQQGNLLMQGGDAVAAAECYRAALALHPDHAPTLYNLGNALLATGDLRAAEASFAAALALAPDHAGAHNNRGNALRRLGRLAEAEAAFVASTRLRPELAGSFDNLASVRLAQHRPEAAMLALEVALRSQPDYAPACNNKGGALLALGRPDEALTWFRRALTLDAALVQARFGEAMALLTLGEFGAGWVAYESRWLDPRFCEGERVYAAPWWRGEDLSGRRVLLHAEQGLGDTIQFVRYATLLRQRGVGVLLEVQAPLLRLLGPLGDAAVAAGAALPDHDVHCPLLSLPLAFGTELATVPAAIPYLVADPAQVASWRGRLGGAGLGGAGRRHVGICFSGSPEHPDDALRSLPAAMLLGLARPELVLHVVQKDIADSDAAALLAAPETTAHGPALGDFVDTAALLAALDLLITVDTSVAHLAGALGLPAWVLLQHAADFRWLRDRRDSPWYPTLLLFRQDSGRSWLPVIAAVAGALDEWLRDASSL